MPLFKAKSTEDAEAVAAKLAAARAALDSLQCEYQERALEAALADTPDALIEIEGKVASAQRRVASLELAEAEAERRESQRLAAARELAEKSRVGALRQHQGTLLRAAAAFEDASQAQLAAWRDLERAVGKIDKLLSPRELQTAFGGPGMIRAKLGHEIDLEHARQAALDGGALPPWLPADTGIGSSFRGLLPHGVHVTELPGLTDRVRKRFDFASLVLGLEPPAPVVDPPAEPEAAPAPVADPELPASAETAPAPSRFAWMTDDQLSRQAQQLAGLDLRTGEPA